MLKKIMAVLAASMAVLGGLAVAATPAQASGGPYYYAGFNQDLTPTQAAGATAVSGNITAYSITTTSGTHALAEVSVQTDNGATPVAAQTRDGVVEAGYTQANGGSLKVFVSRFVNSVWGGSYTGTGDGFVTCTKVSPYNCTLPAYLNPGDALTSGSTYTFSVTHTSGAWWIAVSPNTGCPAGKSCFLGSYPDNLWTGASPAVTFNRPDFVQFFGEVHNTAAPASVCTNMGDGNYGTSTTGAVVGSVTYSGLTTADVQLTNKVETDPSMYTAYSLSSRTFRYGGPGAC